MALHVRILRGEVGLTSSRPLCGRLNFQRNFRHAAAHFSGDITQVRRARPVRGRARGGASSRGPLASASHEAGARGKGGWHAARRNSARSAHAADLRPGRRPAHVVDILAHFPEARGDPLGDLLRLLGPQCLPHSGNVLGLGKASLLLPVVLQIAPGWRTSVTTVMSGHAPQAGPRRRRARRPAGRARMATDSSGPGRGRRCDISAGGRLRPRETPRARARACLSLSLSHSPPLSPSIILPLSPSPSPSLSLSRPDPCPARAVDVY